MKIWTDLFLPDARVDRIRSGGVWIDVDPDTPLVIVDKLEAVDRVFIPGPWIRVQPPHGGSMLIRIESIESFRLSKQEAQDANDGG